MCKPIIKWVGGKRQLLDIITEKMPNTYGTYFEPFFGGGAVYFALRPERAVINDYNDQLVNVYYQIKSNAEKVMALLDRFEARYNSTENKKEYYYLLRKEYNKCIRNNEHSVRSAALVIFLNKSGFNGLYRCNKRGEYNVSFGNKKAVHSYDAENIAAVSQSLLNASITCGDFEKCCDSAKAGDFVFFDSPYYDTFDIYQAGGFSEDDHKRLAALFKRLTKRRVYCILTNSNTDFIKELYSGYDIEVVDVKRSVNCDPSKRTGQEIIVTNNGAISAPFFFVVSVCNTDRPDTHSRYSYQDSDYQARYKSIRYYHLLHLHI